MHVSLRAGAILARDLLAAVGVDDSSSRYAEPDADGVKPVLRTNFTQASVQEMGPITALCRKVLSCKTHRFS